MANDNDTSRNPRCVDIDEGRKALICLYVATDPAVADEVNRKLLPLLNELEEARKGRL